MPNYVLNRNHVHRSIFGVVSFEKGKPSWVTPMLEKEIIAIGGERADGETVDPLGPEAEVTLPPTPVERFAALEAAFDILVARNESKEFTGAGVPTVKAVEKIVGFDVDRTEIEQSYSGYKATKAEAA